MRYRVIVIHPESNINRTIDKSIDADKIEIKDGMIALYRFSSSTLPCFVGPVQYTTIFEI